MAAKKYLSYAAGRIKEIVAVVVSAGAGNDGDLVALDATGKLDASVLPSGFGQNTKVVQASENLATNDLVNIHDVGGTARVRKADASSLGMETHGFVKANVTAGANATVYLSGNTMTGLTGLAPGARQYMSDTAGEVTETPITGTGNIAQKIGDALTDTEIAFEPEEPIELA